MGLQCAKRAVREGLSPVLLPWGGGLSWAGVSRTRPSEGGGTVYLDSRGHHPAYPDIVALGPPPLVTVRVDVDRAFHSILGTEQNILPARLLPPGVQSHG